DLELTLNIRIGREKLPLADVPKTGEKYLIDLRPGLKTSYDGSFKKDLEKSVKNVLPVPGNLPEDEINNIQRMFYLSAAIELLAKKAQQGAKKKRLMSCAQNISRKAYRRLRDLGVEDVSEKLASPEKKALRGKMMSFFEAEIDEGIIQRNVEKLAEIVKQTKEEHKTVIYEKDEPTRPCVIIPIMLEDKGEILGVKGFPGEQVYISLGVEDGSLKLSSLSAHINLTKAIERYNEEKAPGEGPASLFSLDKKYALEKAPRIEEGIFTAALFAVLLTLFVLEKITLKGFLLGIGISSALFIGAHFVNYLRAPPEVKEKDFYTRLRWTFKAPLKVGLLNFCNNSLAALGVFLITPLAIPLYFELPAFVMLISLLYYVNSEIHRFMNETAFKDGDHAPAALGSNKFESGGIVQEAVETYASQHVALNDKFKGVLKAFIDDISEGFGGEIKEKMIFAVVLVIVQGKGEEILRKASEIMGSEKSLSEQGYKVTPEMLMLYRHLREKDRKELDKIRWGILGLDSELVIAPQFWEKMGDLARMVDEELVMRLAAEKPRLFDVSLSGAVKAMQNNEFSIARNILHQLYHRGVIGDPAFVSEMGAKIERLIPEEVDEDLKKEIIDKINMKSGKSPAAPLSRRGKGRTIRFDDNKGPAPGVIHLLKEAYAPNMPFWDYAIKVAPWLEEGIFTLLPYTVFSILLWLGNISFTGFLIRMGISYGVYFIAHLINIIGVRRPITIEMLKWVFTAPLKVVVKNLILSASFGYGLTKVDPRIDLLIIPLVIVFTVYTAASAGHMIVNIQAQRNGNSGPATIGGGRRGKKPADEGEDRQRIYGKVMRSVRKHFARMDAEDHFTTCLNHAVKLAQELRKLNMPADVYVTSEEIWNLADKSLLHFWVETEERILDPYPEDLEDIKAHTGDVISDVGVICKKEERYESIVYRHGVNAAETIWKSSLQGMVQNGTAEHLNMIKGGIWEEVTGKDLSNTGERAELILKRIPMAVELSGLISALKEIMRSPERFGKDPSAGLRELTRKYHLYKDQAEILGIVVGADPEKGEVDEVYSDKPYGIYERFMVLADMAESKDPGHPDYFYHAEVFSFIQEYGDRIARESDTTVMQLAPDRCADHFKRYLEEIAGIPALAAENAGERKLDSYRLFERIQKVERARESIESRAGIFLGVYCSSKGIKGELGRSFFDMGPELETLLAEDTEFQKIYERSVAPYHEALVELESSLKAELSGRLLKTPELARNLTVNINDLCGEVCDSSVDWLLGIGNGLEEERAEFAGLMKVYGYERYVYQGAPYYLLRELLKILNLTGDDVLYDLGSGYGRVCIYTGIVSEAGKTVGIELTPKRAAASSAAKEALGLDNVEFRQGPAQDQDYSDGTVFFMFNPFIRETLELVCAKLKEVAREKTIRVVFWGGDAEDYDYFNGQDWLRPVNRIGTMVIYESFPIAAWLDEASQAMENELFGVAQALMDKVISHIVSHPNFVTSPEQKENYREKAIEVLRALYLRGEASPRMIVLLRGLERKYRESMIRKDLGLIDELQKMNFDQLSKAGREGIDKYAKKLWLGEVNIKGDFERPTFIAGRYEVKESILGSGTFSKVYMAWDHTTNERVVMRILKPHENPAYTLGFLRGYTVLKDLDDVYGVSNVYNAGYWKNEGGDERFFMVMRLIKGKSLESIIQNFKHEFTLEEIKVLAKGLFRILEQLDKRELIHADLTSANILFEEIGYDAVGNPKFDFANPVLTDFDYSMRLSGGFQFVKTAVGSPHYLPPEAFGRPTGKDRYIFGQFTSKTDIYEVGCILYRLLAGKLPFEKAGKPDSWVNKLLKEAPDVRDFNKDIPEALAGFVMKLIKQKPGDRFRSAGEAREELERIGEGTLNKPADRKDLASRTKIFKLFTGDETARPCFIPDERVSRWIQGDEVSIAPGFVGVVELNEGEKVYTTGLAKCSAIMARGKKKNGKYVYILGHLPPAVSLAQQLMTIFAYIRDMSLESIEIYFEGPDLMKGILCTFLENMKDELKATVITDENKNIWRKEFELGKITVNTEGFVSEQTDNDGIKEPVKRAWEVLPMAPADEETVVKDVVEFEKDAMELLREDERQIEHVNYLAREAYGTVVIPAFSGETIETAGGGEILKAARNGEVVADHFLSGLCEKFGWPRFRMNVLTTAVYELCYNVQKHGGGGIVTLRKLVSDGEEVGVEIIARDMRPEVFDLKKAMEFAFSEEAERGGRGHGLRSLIGTLEDFNGEIVCETGGLVYKYNAEEKAFEEDTGEKTRVETGTRFKLMLVKKEEITPAVKTVRHPYSDERHVSPDEFRAQAVMAIRSVLQTEKVVDRLAQVMIDLAESAEEAGREEKEKIVLALDLELGEKDV
ncbi:MAG: protein kinase, partial [Candidatus Omnitrophota bacterium]